MAPIIIMLVPKIQLDQVMHGLLHAKEGIVNVTQSYLAKITAS